MSAVSDYAIVGFILVSILLWIRCLYVVHSGQTWLGFQERHPVPWGVLHLFTIAGIYLTCQLLIQLWWWGDIDSGVQFEEMSTERTAQNFLLLSVSSLVSCLASLGLLRCATGATWTDLGMDWKQGLNGIRIGSIAFVMLAVPIYALQGILTLICKALRIMSAEHPLFEMLKEENSARSFWIAFCAAVLVAPIWEEIAFRLVLQGWLENVVYTFRWMSDPTHDPRKIDGFLLRGGGLTSRVFLPASDGPTDHTVIRPSWVPIVLSSVLFSAMHIGHGPAPIPLFFLSLGLGYLYQRTHNLFPCIVVHMLLNGTTWIFLWRTLGEG